jgi:type I restriction enzyme, S subunit
MSTDLPAGWQTSCLKELASAIGGGTPPKSEPKYWIDGTFPWVSPKDMKTRVVTDSEDHVTEAALDRLSVVPSDSILVVVRSGILSRTLPVAQAAIPVTVNQDMRAFVPMSGISSSYLAWQLIAKEREILSSCSKDGTTVASIEGSALSQFPLVVAPQAEQTRIVAKLEELLSDLDAGVAELKAAQKKLQQYRQSLLKAAVEGALTADWREAQRQQRTPTETGAQLLARILTERRARWEARQLAKFKEQGKAPTKDWQKKYPEPVQPDTTDLPALPTGWAWATIDQLATIGTGVTPLRSKGIYYEGGDVPWVTSGALNDDVVVGAKEYVTSRALTECRLEIYPAGALLVAMYGEGKTRGKCSELAIPATINQAIAALVLEESASECKSYLKSFLAKSYDDMRSQASGGVQPNLNLEIIRSIPFPLPPLVEQRELTARLQTQLDSARGQSWAAELSFKQASAQQQNILRAAFRGQLIPQDPNDEPASTLLARIRTERSSVPKVRKTKKYAEA